MKFIFGLIWGLLFFTNSLYGKELRYRALPEMRDSHRYMIEFHKAPLIHHPEDERGQEKKALRTYRKRVLKKIASISLDQLEVEHEFDTLIHAVSAELDPSTISKVRRLPEVKKVSKVQALYLPEIPEAKENNFNTDPEEEKLYPPLNIPEVWKKTGLQGKGIRIAVLDSGVDYKHPDLGGCFGKGCKVAGGYDLVNKDPDPMDDHRASHGTHVAGIAAGNGRKMGVAPQAEVWAYKVCHWIGFCFSDAIVKALELAVDPNQDGDFSDSAHVINMSFGSRGGSENLVELATEAVADFAVPVSSAGNSGALNLIGAPAAARRAIAVGASEGTEKLASFSNVGPTHDFRFKPNVVAPGVGIWSTAIGGKYLELSGTSMASPFVAGLAALITESFKEDLENLANRVAEALAKNAKPIPYERFLKTNTKPTPLEPFYYHGHGLVQPTAAIEKKAALIHLAKSELLAPQSARSDLGAHLVTYPFIQDFFLMGFKCLQKIEGSLSVSVDPYLGTGAELEVFPKNVKCSKAGQSFSLKFRVRQATEALPPHKGYPSPFGFLLKLGQGEKTPLYVRPIAGFIRARYALKLLRKERLFHSIQLLDARTGTRIKLPIDYEADDSEFVETEAFLTPGLYTEMFRGQTNFLLRPELRLWIQTNVKVERETKKNIERKHLEYHTTFEFKDSNGNIQPSARLSLEFMSPFHESGWSRGFSWRSNARASILSNQVDSAFHRTASLVWDHPDKSDLVSDRLSFEKKENKVSLPTKGYFPLQFNPKLEGIPWPKTMCFRLWKRDESTRHSFSSEHETLSSNVSIGIGTIGIPSVMAIFAPVLQKNSACFYHRKSTNARLSFLPNGEPAMVNSQGHGFESLSNPIEIGTSTPFLVRSGSIYLQKKSFSYAVGTSSGRHGEDWLAENVRYKITDTTSGETLKEGTGGTGPSLRPIPLGKYRFTRELDYGHGKMTAETHFTVPESNEKQFHYLPDIQRFTWKEKEDGTSLIYLVHRTDKSKPSPGSPLKIAKLYVRPNEGERKDWQELTLKSLETVAGVLKAEFKPETGKKLAQHEVKVELENEAGDRQVMVSTNPFFVRE